MDKKSKKSNSFICHDHDNTKGGKVTTENMTFSLNTTRSLAKGSPVFNHVKSKEQRAQLSNSKFTMTNKYLASTQNIRTPASSGVAVSTPSVWWWWVNVAINRYSWFGVLNDPAPHWLMIRVF